MGEGRTLEKPVPAQLHGQTQRPCLHVGRQRFYQTSSSTWYSSYSMGRDSRGKGSVIFKVLSPSPGPPVAPILSPYPPDSTGPGPGAWRTPSCLDAGSPLASRPLLRLPLQGLSPPASPGEMLLVPGGLSQKLPLPAVVLCFPSSLPWNLQLSCLWVCLCGVSAAPSTRGGPCLFSAAPPAPGCLGLPPPSWEQPG